MRRLLVAAFFVSIIKIFTCNAFKYLPNSHDALKRTRSHNGVKQEGWDEDDYLSQLIKANEKAKRRYFFPNHNGGKGLPKNFKKIISSAIGKYDLPELDELDNLHEPEKSLKLSLEFAESLYGSLKSFYLVNGSTGGILMAMFALKSLYQRANSFRFNPGIFLITRNAHKSVFDGLKLLDCASIILPVEMDDEYQIPLGVESAVLEEMLQLYEGKICGVIITRPTYQGVYNSKNEFRAQIEICHRYSAPIIVDEAHGSHLKFLDGQDAISCGADLVVQSTHKGLMTLSQTGILHVGKALPNTVNLSAFEVGRIVQDSFSSFTTTSPNSLLLASLHASIQYFARHGSCQLQKSRLIIEDSKRKLKRDHFVRLLESSTTIQKKKLFVDPFKLNVQFRDPASGNLVNGVDVDNLLCDELGIYCELNFPSCVTYVLPVSSAASITYLFECFKTLQASRFADSTDQRTNVLHTYRKVSRKSAESELYLLTSKTIELNFNDKNLMKNFIGKISAETVSIYPPGIPILIRGEVLTDSHLLQLREMQTMIKLNHLPPGCFLQGMRDQSLSSLDIFLPAHDEQL